MKALEKNIHFSLSFFFIIIWCVGSVCYFSSNFSVVVVGVAALSAKFFSEKSWQQRRKKKFKTCDKVYNQLVIWTESTVISGYFVIGRRNIELVDEIISES